MGEKVNKVLTIDELADYIKISKSTLYKLVREGKVPSRKIGRHWRFHKDVIDSWFKIKNKTLVSPLRYPGGKRWLSGYISRSIIQNELMPELFVELFAGGSSISLKLLQLKLVKRIALIDRDPLIASFWQTVFFDTDWLIDQIWKSKITIQKWEQMRRLNPVSVRQRAFKCLYLNRTSFSGVLAPSAGPIGGKNQKSKYKIDCRFKKETLISRIRKISEYKDRIAFIWNLHWRDAVARILRMQQTGALPECALFYLDPPFYNKADALYTFYFKHADHVSLRDFLIALEQHWILSYDFCSEIISLYKNESFQASNVNLVYTASQKGERGIGKELIVSNLPRMLSELQLGIGKKTDNPVHLSELTNNEVILPDAESVAQGRTL